jgi:5-aminolevulinate synthase
LKLKWLSFIAFESFSNLYFLAFTEKLVEVWQEAGLPLANQTNISCNFCGSALHFDLMSEWEKSYFGNMEPQYITMSA